MLNSALLQRNITYLISKYSRLIPLAEVEILLSSILRYTRTELYVDNDGIGPRLEDICDSFVKRRLQREPLQYITGSAQFMGYDFIVNKDVFIPRPETELLVQEVFHYTSSAQHYTKSAFRILDICTGSGNIAVSLARLIPHVEICAVDMPKVALDIAQKNAKIHKVDKNINFYSTDIFEGLPFNKSYKFDIIVCNPPYIRSDEIDDLQEEVRCEPRIALDGGGDGLDFYRRLEEIVPSYLKKQRALFLEVGIGQAQDVINIFKRRRLFEPAKTAKDFSGIDRVLWIDLL